MDQKKMHSLKGLSDEAVSWDNAWFLCFFIFTPVIILDFSMWTNLLTLISQASPQFNKSHLHFDSFN